MSNGISNQALSAGPVHVPSTMINRTTRQPFNCGAIMHISPADRSTYLNSHTRIISLEATLTMMQFDDSTTPQQSKPRSVPKISTLSIKTTIDTEYLLVPNTPVGRQADWSSKYISFVEDEGREPRDVSDHPVHRRSEPRPPLSPPLSAKKAVVADSIREPPAAGEARDTSIFDWGDCILSIEACTCGYGEPPLAASSIESNEEADLIGLSILGVEHG